MTGLAGMWHQGELQTEAILFPVMSPDTTEL